MKIKIADCCGMCSGVKRALEIVEQALKVCGDERLYVYHEIVHNSMVINDLKKRGVIFVREISEIPDGAVTVFSAHGVSRNVEKQAEAKNLRVFDATCLLVRKNHKVVEEAFEQKKKVVFIGKRFHPECIGTVGRVDDGYCYVIENEDDISSLPDCAGEIISLAQTTLSEYDVEKIKNKLSCKYPSIKHSDGICFATSARQNAVRKLASECDCIIVVGSSSSSNSCRLVQIAGECGCRALLADSIDDLKETDWDPAAVIGITAGASTPQRQIDEISEFFSGR